MTYPRPLRAIHWGIALLVTCQLALAVVLTQLRSLEYGQILLGLHRQLGLVILLLVAARFVLGVRHKVPAQADYTLPAWQRASATLVHRLFFAILVVQPLIGLVVTWARGDTVSVLGILHLPAPFEISDAARERLMTVHGGVALLLFALCIVHVGAVIFNRVVRRVSVIERMLPASVTDLLVNRVSVAAQLSLAFGIVVAIALTVGLNAVLTYRSFSAATSAFQQGELAAADQTRAAQVAWKELLGLAAAGKNGEDAKHVRELADLATSSLTEAAAHTEPGDIRTQIEALNTQIGRLDDAALATLASVQDVETHLQDIVDSQGLSALQHRTDNEQQAARGHDLIVVTILPMMLAGIIAALLLARSVTGSLKRMSDLIHSIESERHAGNITVMGDGEFAALTRDIVRMRAAVEQRSHAAAEQRAQFDAERVRLAEEQQTREVEAERLRSVERQTHRERLAADFEQQIAGIVETVLRTAKDLTSTAGSMAESAASTSERSRDASSTAQQTSGTAARIARGTEELSVAARSVRENAEKSQSRAQLAVKEAAAAKERIDHLLAAARQIGTITAMISGVARQTNLLALNARIEAARAGQFGLGFSVVANEVKDLANQTSNATADIGKRIDEVTTAAVLSSESLERLREVVVGVEVAAAAIFVSTDEQSASTRDIADRVSEISTSTDSVARDIREAEKIAGITEQLSDEVAHGAAIVDEQAMKLNEQVTRFVEQLRVRGTARGAEPHASEEQVQALLEREPPRISQKRTSAR